MNKMFKKLTVLFLSFLVLFSVVSPVNASVWYNQSYEDWKIKVFDTQNDTEMFGERYTYAQVKWIFYSVFSLVTSSLLNDNSALMLCLSANSDDVIDVGDCASGAEKFIEDMGGTVETPDDEVPADNIPEQVNLQTPPDVASKGFMDYFLEKRELSAISYVSGLGDRLKLIPEAQAQDPTAGYGYNALSPVKLIWEQSRNAAYALFALISVAFAFMIMFRVKISPQAVISVQSALPKLILTVILVTFSYAIAGLVVDLMYLVIGVLSLIFNPFGQAGFSFVLLKFMMGDIPLIPGDLTIFIYFFTWAFATFIIMALSIFGMLATLNLNGAIWGILALILIVVVGILTVWWALKTTWMLFKALVSFLVLVMFAPLQLTLGAIVPSLGFGTWLKQLVANLAVFPVVGVMFLLGYYFLISAVGEVVISVSNFLGIQEALTEWLCSSFITNPSQLASCQTDTVTSLYTADFQMPFLGNVRNYMSMFYVIISMVIVSMIPKTADMVKSLIEGKFAYGSALGEDLGAAKTAGQGFLGGYVTRYETEKGKETPGGSALRSMGIIRK